MVDVAQIHLLIDSRARPTRDGAPFDRLDIKPFTDDRAYGPRRASDGRPTVE